MRVVSINEKLRGSGIQVLKQEMESEAEKERESENWWYYSIQVEKESIDNNN